MSTRPARSYENLLLYITVVMTFAMLYVLRVRVYVFARLQLTAVGEV